MKIGFDHAYQTILDEGVFRRLGERGFLLDPRCVEHPGAMFCRFIKFNSRDPRPAGMGYQYLEFAELRDFAKLRAEFPKATDDELQGPGLSLNADAGLEALHAELSRELPDDRPSLAHKNYDWKTDNVSRRPGWNFLSFKGWILKEVNVWCTEYEPSPDRPVHQGRFEHPNSAECLHGLIMNVPAAELRDFARVARTQVANGGFRLQDGIEVYGLDHPSLPPALRDRPKRCPVRAISFLCTDWTRFLETAQPDEVFPWGQAQAARLQMPDRGWDLIALNREP